MSNDDYVSGSIKNVLLNGINLFLDSPEEEQHYIYKLFEYFDAETEFGAYLHQEQVVEIENEKMQPVVELMIQNSTLFFVPFVEDVLDVFTEVLKFIAYRHAEVLRDFRGVEEVKIESPHEVNQKNEEKTKEFPEEESSSDDDYEWI